MPNHDILDLQPAHIRELQNRYERAMADHGYDSLLIASGAAPTGIGMIRPMYSRASARFCTGPGWLARSTAGCWFGPARNRCSGYTSRWTSGTPTR